jgi:REP element-mobilizing transposase RayT
MKYEPQKHPRRSIRLEGYDYSQVGAYHVTIVAQNRACLFGNVVEAEMRLNDVGAMLQTQWQRLPGRFPNVELDEFLVMPNHFHGILVLTDKPAIALVARDTVDNRATTRVAPTDVDASRHDPILGDIVGAWKSIVTDEYIRGVHQWNWEPFDRKMWQRNYWEHIIRDEPDLERIRTYIVNNPANWESDENNPKNANRP